MQTEREKARESKEEGERVWERELSKEKDRRELEWK